MFEDATFESTGRIRTRSRGWMIATFFLNGSVLVGLILIPLIYPEALPRQAMAFLLTVPPPPQATPPPPAEPKHAFHGSTETVGIHLFLPPIIPPTITRFDGPEEPTVSTSISIDPGEIPGSGSGAFTGHTAPVVVHGPQGPVRLPSTLVAGLLLYKAAPQYPVIAREARIEGTVALQATISKSGRIENLRVMSGPTMLQQAALDAVQTWRYRPYLLNNVPVEVETTVNVVFTLGR
jgi:protein TonB